MARKATAIARPLPRWDDNLTVKQARLVKLIGDEVYDTVKEAAVEAGYSALQSTIYTVLSSGKIQRALDKYRNNGSTQALDLIKSGESIVSSSLEQAKRDLQPAARVQMGLALIKAGSDKASVFGHAERTPVELDSITSWLHRVIRAAVRCGMERPEVARRILSRDA